MTTTLGDKVQVEVLPTAEDVAAFVATRVWQVAEAAIAQHGRFHGVLAGGTTFKKAYAMLAQKEPPKVPWHLYLGDERALPATDPERNSRMIEETWLDNWTAHWHPIPAEQNPNQVMTHYNQVLASVDWFDLVLLGMGEDGHTASLFPGHDVPEDVACHSVHHAPKPPPTRYTLSLSRLARTRNLLVAVTGASKQAAITRWLQAEDLPIASVVHRAQQSAVTLVVDQEAWV
jgi:6-phosphogluconolactonase